MHLEVLLCCFIWLVVACVVYIMAGCYMHAVSLGTPIKPIKPVTENKTEI